MADEDKDKDKDEKQEEAKTPKPGGNGAVPAIGDRQIRTMPKTT
ncbi:MAG: hypothetical protein QOE72_3424 [Chloroflexota bacterium]|jgi:hypothetical protein|nr:hypothetical protein [Chloroflexota bacterium]